MPAKKKPIRDYEMEQSLFAERNEARAALALSLHALLEADNALTDYVDRLEKQGGMMGYGRSVIAKVRLAHAAGQLVLGGHRNV